ncbi:MAG: leucine--tRNA ligase [Candidatus Micrarchaeota archaeon]|nr:leucine--tRNA ligase [Candidatus Micrarchaeota archaeon]
MDIRKIELEVNKELLESSVSNIDYERKKFFIAPAFPYPNSPQHIGHGRTYTTTDIYARFMRLKGYNVLFPMAFHVTGTPIIAMASRLKEKDKELIEIFTKIYGIPEEKLEELSDPEKLVMYFSREIEQGMKEMGYSIDWTRKFYSFDKHFNKFIEWHFKKLYDKGYLVKGEHPVPWCSKCNNALGAHDTKGDKDPEIEQVSVLFFKIKSKDMFLGVVTYRPETIFGVTNIWVVENSDYQIIKLQGKKVIVSKESLQNIGMQYEYEPYGSITGKELLEYTVINPIDNTEVPLLPATFIDLSFGTGIVMSVPAHAPYDYLALRDLGFPKGIKLKVIINIEGFEVPAKEVCEKLNVKDQKDQKAEDATKEVYRLELLKGKMRVSDNKFDGLPVEMARQRVKEHLSKSKDHINLYIIANHPVYCRCNNLAGVKLVKDQWFIDYGNKSWKEETKKCLSMMKILPEESRKIYLDTIEWLEKKACTREKGLGTRFPFDRNKMIEALSDSTIYMAFYTISDKITRYKPEQLTEEFFDYIFYGKGKPVDNLHDELRKSFEYWYPLDSRHSGYDLVRNHLPFFIFNHVAVFPQKHWPKQIVTNGFVLMEGKKMSKSLGNILPLRKAISKYSADVVRFAIVNGADLDSDTDFNEKSIDGIKSRMEYFNYLIDNISKKEVTISGSLVDKWLLNRVNRMIKSVKELYEDVEIRKISQLLFYDFYNSLKWYEVRKDGKIDTHELKLALQSFVILMYPFMPHVCYHWSKKLYCIKSLKEFENIGLPSHDEKLISEKFDKLEELLIGIDNDINEILSLLKLQKVKEIKLIVSANWKRKLISLFKEHRDLNNVIKSAKSMPDLKTRLNEVSKLGKKIIQNIDWYPDYEISQEDEISIIKDGINYLAKKYSVDKSSILIEIEESSKELKAANAMPLKPAIIIK